MGTYCPPSQTNGRAAIPTVFVHLVLHKQTPGLRITISPNAFGALD